MIKDCIELFHLVNKNIKKQLPDAYDTFGISLNNKRWCCAIFKATSIASRVVLLIIDHNRRKRIIRIFRYLIYLLKVLNQRV